MCAEIYENCAGRARILLLSDVFFDLKLSIWGGCCGIDVVGHVEKLPQAGVLGLSPGYSWYSFLLMCLGRELEMAQLREYLVLGRGTWDRMECSSSVFGLT